jgi:methionine synthase II (cobalamin-independent)
LRKFEWTIDLDWAVDGFRISSSGVGDETQIHTHTCYSEFNEMKKSDFAGSQAAFGFSTLDQSRLRSENAKVGRGEVRACQYGGRGAGIAGVVVT